MTALPMGGQSRAGLCLQNAKVNEVIFSTQEMDFKADFLVRPSRNVDMVTCDNWHLKGVVEANKTLHNYLQSGMFWKPCFPFNLVLINSN